jgi:hypothetical protein
MGGARGRVIGTAVLDGCGSAELGSVGEGHDARDKGLAPAARRAWRERGSCRVGTGLGLGGLARAQARHAVETAWCERREG